MKSSPVKLISGTVGNNFATHCPSLSDVPLQQLKRAILGMPVSEMLHASASRILLILIDLNWLMMYPPTSVADDDEEKDVVGVGIEKFKFFEQILQ